MFTLKSNRIEDFPFEEYSELNLSELEELAKTHRLREYNSWMLPQIVAHYASWQLDYNVVGKVDCRATSRLNIKTPWQVGLWRVVTQLKRSSLVKQQIDPQYTNYSALVPIILSAQKRYNNIPYNSWQIDKDCWLVEKNLLQAMLWVPADHVPEHFDSGFRSHELRYGLSESRLLELRRQGLAVRDAAVKGRTDNPISNWCLRNMRGTELEGAPKLVGTMLCQIWVAHPSLRTPYMILDPNDWDWMPPALIVTELFDTQKLIKQTTSTDLPWL